jgi:predicted RNase H-like nuclease (RuvC/YqgF family)
MDPDSLSIAVTNLGGIEGEELTIPAGVTVLSGQNATNRTSLLQSIAAGLGGDESAATLKTDAEHGDVTLELDSATAVRQYSRRNGTVSRDGTPLTDDAALVDTYVAIFATNPAREAVRAGGRGIRDVLMRGVDTRAIKEEISELKQEKSALTDQLDEIKAATVKLQEQKQDRAELRDELEDIESQISSIEAEISDHRAASEAIEEAEETVEALERKRDELQTVENRIDTTKNTLDELRSEKNSIAMEVEDLSVQNEKKERLEADIRNRQNEIAALRRTITQLSDIIEHNRSILNGDGLADLLKNSEQEQLRNSEEQPADDESWTYGSGWSEASSVVDSLAPSQESVECWTCGSVVKRAEIESRIETLVDIRQEKNATLQRVQDDLDELQDTVQAIEQQQAERTQLESDLEEANATIRAEEERLADLRDRREALQSEVEELQSTVAETEGLRESDLSDAYERLTSLERRRGTVENELRTTESTIRRLQDQIDRQESVEQSLEETREQLEAARGRIDDLERETVEKFNAQMDDLLTMLAYDNVSRVWLERIVSEGEETADFELHVVREGPEGTAYEDTVETLSESEREIIGIVSALAGYLVHDVAETVPFILFDSVEAIDADRLATIFDYIEEYATFIVAALLPEDAAAIDRPTLEAPAFD